MKNIVNLGNVATYINGYAFKPSDWAEDGTPIIRIQDLTGNSYQMNRFKGIVDSKYDVNSGDVLISWSASLGVYVWNRGNAVLNQHIFKVVFDKEEVDKDFFVFQIDNLLKRAANQAHGATMRHLTKPVFDALPFYLPDIKTQRLISSKLNLIVHLIEDHHEQLKKLDELIRSRFIEMFGDSQSNPKGFPYKRINEFAKCIAGATPSTKRKEYWSNGIIPWMSSGEVNYKRIWETEKRISQIGYDSCSTKMIPAHTVVIAMAGQGRTRGTVAVAEIPLCTNQSLCSIITDGTVDTDYLFTYLQFQYNNLRNISNGSSGRGGLNIKLIGQFAVLVPPLAIQQKFSNFLKEIDKSKYREAIFLYLLEDIRICCNI